MNKYAAILKIHVLETLQYRFDILFRGVGACVYTFALFHLWKAIYVNQSIGTFTLVALAWYTLLGQAIRGMGGRPVENISRTIQDGTIISFINKPINYLWLQASTIMGKGIFNFISSIILGGIMLNFLIGMIPLKIIYVIPVLIAIIAGVLINFLIGFVLASAAFWIEDAMPIDWVYDKTVFILGGFLFPLELLPGVLQSIATKLPTAFFIYYPTKLAVQFSWQLFFHTIIGQGIYIVTLIVIGQFLLKRGIKKLSVNGG